MQLTARHHRNTVVFAVWQAVSVQAAYIYNIPTYAIIRDGHRRRSETPPNREFSPSLACTTSGV